MRKFQNHCDLAVAIYQNDESLLLTHETLFILHRFLSMEFISAWLCVHVLGCKQNSAPLSWFPCTSSIWSLSHTSVHGKRKNVAKLPECYMLCIKTSKTGFSLCFSSHCYSNLKGSACCFSTHTLTNFVFLESCWICCW